MVSKGVLTYKDPWMAPAAGASLPSQHVEFRLELQYRVILIYDKAAIFSDL